MLALITAALAAPCTMSTLGPALTDVENAYLNGDASALNKGYRVVKKNIRCDVTPSLAARYHRANALSFALNNDWDTAEVHLRASLAASPLDVELPLDNNDRRLSLAWQRAQETPIVWRESALGMVNGSEIALRPDAPYIGRSGGSPGPVIRWAGVGLAAAAGGLYAGSMVSRSHYDTLSSAPRSEQLGAYHTTNNLFFASVGTAALGAGLFAVSFAL